MLHWFVPGKNWLIFSGYFDLLPQHFLLPGYKPYKHANEVYDELIDSIYNMNPDAKSKLLKQMATVLGEIATETNAQSNQRVEATPISEDE